MRGRIGWCLGIALTTALASTRPAGAEPRGSIIVGVDGSWLTGEAGWAYPDMSTKPTIGMAYRHRLAADWILRAGVELSRRGGSRGAHATLVTTIVEFGITDSTDLGRSRRFWSESWIDVPLLLERRLGSGRVRPYVFAGPEGSWRNGANDPHEGRLPSPERARAFEGRAVGGVGMEIKDGRSLVMLELLGSLDLQDVFPRGRGPDGRSTALGARLVLAP